MCDGHFKAVSNATDGALVSSHLEVAAELFAPEGEVVALATRAPEPEQHQVACAERTMD